MSIIAVHHNPWNPGKDVQRIKAVNGSRICDLAPVISKPYICLVNGEVILRKYWTREIAETDIVQFLVLPQGGGGSNPLRMILMLAVMVFAPYVGGVIGSALEFGKLATTFVTAAIGIVGAALVNVLIPAKTSSGSIASTESASPTYSVSSQGNSARIGEPIPVQYGRHISWPDFAASPYVEYSGNEQYLYQLFCIGQGEYDIETIRIEDTDINQFAEVSTEVIPPGAKLTLFPANVETSGEVSGQEMLTGTPLGAFVANEADTTANMLAFDVVCTRGLYWANDSGTLSEMSVSFRCEARLIDDYGTALSDWTVLGSEVIKAATSTPQRRSYRYTVSPGRYEARITRTDTKNTNSRAGHEICWASLRAYLEDAGTVYPGMTLLAVRIRATNNISQQASRKINVIATRKLPVWNPETGWSAPVATRSIAWAFADACKAEYSAKLNDGRIDLPALYELDRI
ncbi:host specificity factor TipJ family phage tail protein, partial [Oxalobacter formigenes]